MALLRLRKPPNIFQLDNHTGPDRYPALFQFAREHFEGRTKLRLLSFGCSTGEEVSALRRYFPEAKIVGIDINPHNIAVCRSRVGRDYKMTFAVAGTTGSEEADSYDAIFCLSVLRHGGLRAAGTERCDHLIRFDDFERTVGDFARCLKPGGLLFITNANFRLCDTEFANRFEVLLLEDHHEPDPRVPIFGRNNRRIKDVYYNELGFQKLGRCGLHHPDPNAGLKEGDRHGP